MITDLIFQELAMGNIKFIDDLITKKVFFNIKKLNFYTVENIDIKTIKNILKVYIEYIKIQKKAHSGSPEGDRMNGYHSFMSNVLNSILQTSTSILHLRQNIIAEIQPYKENDLKLLPKSFFEDDTWDVYPYINLYLLTYGILFNGWDYTTINKKIVNNEVDIYDDITESLKHIKPFGSL